ncbi:uncharacterized protein PV09_09276 [Verruconis gallopava]|uniref:Proteasome assembly chaperone 3 n=1 Tax=Verruconis gallopava TaxID=253628 RepID=A0A0D1YE73_9PEZI|nr:uncharacterized protein PV09_09276 [Verruconis gallopava]KIV98996.1 hypothetical protein PV09_09276 [Verruconis gallopava]
MASESDAPVITPFPAPSRTKMATVLSIPTKATSLLFSDKILLTLSQNGRLAHWVHVPLAPAPAADLHAPLRAVDPDTALLPDTHATATTILGGTVPGLDILGQTLATSLASAIASKSPGESRLLVLGLGLDRAMEAVRSEDFAELMGLCLDVL